MTRYAKSHTHIDLARKSSIFLHVVIEQAQFLLMAERANSWLAIRPQSFLAKPALLVCHSIPRVDGESIGKTMIIGQRMKDCSS
jgi:hypothetical protein